MKATVAERGQVTIPKPLRDKLGIRPGTVLDFRDEQGRLTAAKATVSDPIERGYGCLKLGKSTDESMRALRGAA